jgi:putative PIN family toxin of toxin-antitoxin system
MLPLRLVLDTNILVSGALKPDGLERAALVFSLTPPARLFVSLPILDEYRRVLARPELKLRPGRAAQLLALIDSRSHLVNPAHPVAACSDPDDNVFLECAEAARADYLITGNKRYYPKFWKSAKVINAR